MIKKAKKYKFAVIASDVVIFTVLDGKLQVLLIEMKKDPFHGYWAAPGGLVKPDESTDMAAARLLGEKAGVKGVYLEQFRTFGEVGRDPFGRVVSVAYFALIPADGLRLKTTEEYGGVKWFPIRDLPKLAYDHRKIIIAAMAALRERMTSTNIVYSLLPREFTLTDLQKTYEIVFNKPMDKRNFRKKILSLGLVERVSRKTAGHAHRPAAVYQFKKREKQNISML